MINRNKVLEAFQKALEHREGETPIRGWRPRTIALRAHAIYCAGLAPHEKRPKADTFRKFATGGIACEGVVELLQSVQIHPLPPQKLNRDKLRTVFSEAVQRLENRILKGQAKPLQIARRAYDLYTKDIESTPQPSHRTFESLIYGKSADPEIVEIIQTALTRAKQENL